MSISPFLRSQDEIPRALYSPREVEYMLGISHATLYRLIGAGRLEAKKIDGKTVITAESIRRFIAALPSARGADRREAGDARG